MRVLVTGGSGFIGKYIVKELEELGFEVENWDITNGKNLFGQTNVPEGTEVIIHLAAQLEILDVNPVTELVTNVEATIHMLELARKGHVKRFVLASSTAVYGEPTHLPSKETSTIKPFWSYGASKVAAEAYVQQYERLYGIKSAIIRPAIVTGVGEWYGRFVTLNIARVRRGEPMLIFGNGQQTRDFVDVRDVAHLFVLCAIGDIPPLFVVNAGSDKTLRICDMAKIILKYCHSKVKWIDPKVGELGRKPHELKNMWLDMDKSYKVFSWSPIFPIKQTIKEEIEWIMSMNKEEFERWSKVARY
jgi:UDP-glucose 4-epimerase